MNILFVFLVLPHLSNSSMYSDMTKVFHEHGHNVFPMAPISDQAKRTHISNENGIDVLRVKTLNVFNENKYKKGLANVLLSPNYKKAFERFWKDKEIDLVIMPTPSVMFANFIGFVKKQKRANFYLMQKDIFPQNAVDLGLVNDGGLLFKFFKRNEIKLLKMADWVGCTSPGNIKYILKHYPFLEKNRVRLLYNSSNILKVEKDRKILLKYGLEDKFIVVFGGNMGKPQQLENVLRLAEKCKSYPDVIFLLIGQGTEYENLRRIAKSRDLSNLRFTSKLPRIEYFELLSNCSIGLISLHQDFTVPNTPMKVNDYLNAGIPILASIDRDNDLGEMLVNNKMGKYAYADSPDELFQQFVSLYENEQLCKEFGENGRKFCFEYLSSERAYKVIMEAIQN